MSSYVYVKNPNGKTYVYENTTYWDKESKSCKHHRRSIGHLDPDTGEIVPNHRKGDNRPKALSANASDHCIVAATGIEKLLSQAVADMKLAAPLKAVFPDDWERILTCAYYLVSEGGALAHVEKWQQAFSSPYGGILSSQRISELISHMPVYYRIIPGSIKDVNTLQDSLANISFMERASFHYVMDNGFYSGPNIDAFYANHKK